MPKLPEKLPQGLTEAQLDKIFATALPHWTLLIRFALLTGVRYSEMTNLTWNQVRDLPQPHIILTKTKSGKVRTVPLVPEAQELLKGLKRGKGYVFPYRPKYASNFVANSVKKCGFKWHIHQLRHTFAIRFLETGGSKEVLRLLLGHSTISTTEIYGKLTDDGVFAEVNRLVSATADTATTATTSSRS